MIWYRGKMLFPLAAGACNQKESCPQSATVFLFTISGPVRILAKMNDASENTRSRSARMTGHARPEYAPGKD
ncbi:TPA: hypothetical protein N3A29_004747 [Salmonella enterica subsp. diarizonae serovar 16:z10:e,n,x,z15]|nr:hypothetical protein [Salmonella enterica subsp. diarizonae serovar 16:z10:e,n,x,z15]